MQVKAICELCTKLCKFRQNKNNIKTWYCVAAEPNMVLVYSVFDWRSQNKNLFQNCTLTQVFMSKGSKWTIQIRQVLKI